MTHDTPKIRHVTDGWHDLGLVLSFGDASPSRPPVARPAVLDHSPSPPRPRARVCEHWAEFETPVVDTPDGQIVQLVRVTQRDGTVKSMPEADEDGRLHPCTVRSYIGLVLEVGIVQIQLRGRLRHAGERLAIEVLP